MVKIHAELGSASGVIRAKLGSVNIPGRRKVRELTNLLKHSLLKSSQ